MQATPLFLGACALASIAGAVSGTTLNTDPIQRASIGSAEITRPTIAFDASDTGHNTMALPDQYAMTTPDGRVEVAELASRGLYAQRRYAWREAAFEYAPERAYDEPVYEDTGYADAADTSPAPAQANGEPALALAQPAALTVPATEGSPKVIDVALALAAPN